MLGLSKNRMNHGKKEQLLNYAFSNLSMMFLIAEIKLNYKQIQAFFHQKGKIPPQIFLKKQPKKRISPGILKMNHITGVAVIISDYERHNKKMVNIM